MENRNKGEWKGAFKKGSSVGIAGIITFSHEAQEIINLMDTQMQDQLFKDHIEKLASALDTHIHGAVIHRDESAVHAHFLMNAYTKNGESLSSKIDRSVTSRIQDHAGQIWGSVGISRGEKKSDKIARLRDDGYSQSEITKAVVNRKVRQLHEDLPQEISSKKADAQKLAQKNDEYKKQLSEIKTLIAQQTERLQKNQRLHEESLEKLQKTQGDLLKVEKITKNLLIYEKRAADARGELEALGQELSLVTSKIDRRSEILSSNEEVLRTYGLSFDGEGRLNPVNDTHSEISEMNSPRWG